VATTILIVEDEPDTAMLFRDALVVRGFACEVVLSADDCLTRLAARDVELVVTDIQMPGMDGIELCRLLGERYPEVLTIVVTGAGGLETAVAAIRAGAYDYLQKPVKIDALAVSVARALETQSLRREIKRLRQGGRPIDRDGIAGASTAIQDTIALVHRVADSDATVLVTGETGTGKELVARAIHLRSARRDEPFVAINCGAMPAALLESELFGHVRGAFTDAKQSHTGLFVQARRGTLFLDEIGEMPLEMQVKLLRVLQQRMVRPVGGDHEVPVEARIVAATNKDLETEVDERRFRQDLFYRINVVAIPVPPLRRRPGDILVLAQHFLDRAATRSSKPVVGISEQAARLLIDYDWPGNVRELENCMERGVALCRLDQVTVDDLPAKLRQTRDASIVIATGSASDLITLQEMERRYARKVLEAVGGNKAQAARILGIDRRSLYRRLEAARASEPSRDPVDP
jgi:DNA-binding NtrC family response regulator